MPGRDRPSSFRCLVASPAHGWADGIPKLTSAPAAWAQLAVCALLIGVAGTYLSRYGDVIADKPGLGGTWIGLVLVATVTSLPELVTGVSAVTVAGTPEIAVGEVLGSCLFNLLILTVLDLLHRSEPVYTRASHGHVLSAGFGIILIGVVGYSLLPGASDLLPAAGHVGIYTPIIFVLYAVAIRTLFRYESAQRAQFASTVAAAVEERYPDITLRQATLRYLVAAASVVAVGTALPFVGTRIAEFTGWHESFVGTLLIAISTSVPELVVTLAALRIGALDMAIANVLGSNLFNIVVLAVEDLLFGAGPLLAHVTPVHAASSVTAMMMNGIVVVGVLYRPRKRLFRTVGWASLMLLALFLFDSVLLFLHRQ